MLTRPSEKKTQHKATGLFHCVGQGCLFPFWEHTTGYIRPLLWLYMALMHLLRDIKSEPMGRTTAQAISQPLGNDWVVDIRSMPGAAERAPVNPVVGVRTADMHPLPPWHAPSSNCSPKSATASHSATPRSQLTRRLRRDTDHPYRTILSTTGIIRAVPLTVRPHARSLRLRDETRMEASRKIHLVPAVRCSN